jgi:predicted alpha-1,2-mannosidase
MMKSKILLPLLLAFSLCHTSRAAQRYTDLVNPMLGTETLWDSLELGFRPTRRTWGAEVYPGSSLPFAMVQLSPVTMFRSGSGYQYEDKTIYGFGHTAKGHWNLSHVPVMPVRGDDVMADDYGSPFSHAGEEAHPAFYSVFLERYGILAELTSTLRCGFHRYTFEQGEPVRLLVNLPRSNENVRGWKIVQSGPNSFSGYQQTGEKVYFHAECSYPVAGIDSLRNFGGNVIADNPEAAGAPHSAPWKGKAIPIVSFDAPAGSGTLEVRIGLSFVSEEGARRNLLAEMSGKTFEAIRERGEGTWNDLLGNIRIEGGTPAQRGTFYTALYRSMLWPALRSDADGRFTDRGGEVVSKGFRYYTDPSFWDDYRNKLVLLGMLAPDVAADVISSCIDRGEVRGFMPTFFHGDHASVFVTGSYLRGIRGFDVRAAYRLMLRNATVPGPSRPYLEEYLQKGYVSDEQLDRPRIWSEGRAGVTKTQEYSYDDYAVALLAAELGDRDNHEKLMARSQNYRNLFDPSTRFFRGRRADGEWIANFDPRFPYYNYMFREATGWQSAFFAPHDTPGMIALYGGEKLFEEKLDSLFTIPWQGHEAHNLSGFIGQYCHGNQPDHGFPFLYHFIGKPEKSQVIVDSLLNNFYNMGEHSLAYAGMDDAGEMSSWYVLSAIGLYTYSPAEARYLVSVPLFERVRFRLGGNTFTIAKQGEGRAMHGVEYGGRKIEAPYTIDHGELLRGGELTIRTGR